MNISAHPVHFMPLDDAVTSVVQVIVDAQQGYSPASVPCCCRSSVWWNCHCHRTYHAMMQT